MYSKENAWKLQIWVILGQILGHSPNVYYRKSPETPNLSCLTKSKWHQNEEIQQTMTKI